VDGAIEVYRSVRSSDCSERAFMLDAVGIGSETRHEAPWYVLMVELAAGARAREQLALYEREERERRPLPAPTPGVPARPHAWIGCVLYAAVLIIIGLSVANGLWRPDAFDAGALDAARVQAGQWWRVLTALTLHLDGEHLAANLLVGIWFGYLAGRQQGPGHAWFLVLNGAALANLVEALSAPPGHRAVGASTAVFTALGLLSAYSFRTRSRGRQHWALQWAPLVCGVVLLAWFGSGATDGTGEPGAGQIGVAQVDVVAHALGFAAGIALGLTVALPRAQGLLQRIPQWVSGAIALAEIAAAWRLAIGS
jgi:membrane associated rhomboid family serine protease